MINYSIVMRSVNANLLEINQAKSRINQAKQEGKNPDQKDLDLNDRLHYCMVCWIGEYGCHLLFRYNQLHNSYLQR